ncbi:MAG: hypothetical protein KDA25_02080 [Phycisphaerales bacterium]|nr:hypothetical protein [Phycisphaerales bacterium]
MTITNERKVLVGVLSVAGLILGADRLMGAGTSGPDAAAASSPAANATLALSDLVASITADDATATPLAVEPAPSVLVAARLDALASDMDLDLATVTDRFQPAAGWFEDASPPPASGTNEADPAPAPPADHEFVTSHRVSAVMLGRTGTTSGAIVDGRFIPVGGTIDGATLIGVERDRARFRIDGEVVEGRLDQSR